LHFKHWDGRLQRDFQLIYRCMPVVAISSICSNSVRLQVCNKVEQTGFFSHQQTTSDEDNARNA